jgi:hypothetical protein
MLSDMPGIVVTGDAVVSSKPDVGHVVLYLRADGVLLEDAVREASDKVEQVLCGLRDGFRDIKDVQVKDVYMGGGRSAFGTGMTRDKSSPSRPEGHKRNKRGPGGAKESWMEWCIPELRGDSRKLAPA